MNSFTKEEKKLMQKLNTPAKVQDFLNTLEFNFEKPARRGGNGETLKSPLFTLRARKAHCMEGALLGAYILSLHGYKPLIMYIQSTKDDFDHVIAIFKKGGFYGALSKTNHAVLRYREPVYKSIRELVISYFHEYFLDNGKKTLRKYSCLLNLNIFGSKWVTEEGNLWYIDKKLDKMKHYDIAPKKVFKNLRKADKIEIKAGKLVEYKK